MLPHCWPAVLRPIFGHLCAILWPCPVLLQTLPLLHPSRLCNGPDTLAFTHALMIISPSPCLAMRTYELDVYFCFVSFGLLLLLINSFTLFFSLRGRVKEQPPAVPSSVLLSALHRPSLPSTVKLQACDQLKLGLEEAECLCLEFKQYH